jgi:8-oxo-dGTP pyrophosphatase MutT (NUDIX family)/predicted SprT family Zn-dependent metalloprotease
MIRVVACVIERDGTLLLGQRPADKRHGGLWEFPGGKMEPGESTLDAAHRELVEELGVQVRHAHPVEFARQDPGSPFVIEFARVEIEGTPQCLDHATLAWIPEDALFTVPLAPSDRSYALHRRGLAPEAAMTEWLRGWGTIWQDPTLADAVQIRFSTRLRRALGRCRPAAGTITLQASLLHDRPELLMEVLCHEAAHIAAWRRFGPAARPHGAEWRALVHAAGFEPRVRAHILASAPPRQVGSPPLLPFEHRCPVCQFVRYARRPVSVWRCAACRAGGGSGELTITRRTPA